MQLILTSCSRHHQSVHDLTLSIQTIAACLHSLLFAKSKVGSFIDKSNIQSYYMAELVQGEQEHSDWSPDRSVLCYIWTAQMDRSRTEFTDLCD